ncbi:MAG: HupE/UreJ family protein [Alphaproteobacteria bacterium]|nr:HupE/UreJ family protein [Alphaproteobacteria bacterium]
MTHARIAIAFTALLATATPLPALAHGGLPAAGFEAGLAHPFLGADHLLAMLAVGLWAVRLGGGARFVLPAGFLVAMLAGGLVGSGGPVQPLVETGIAGSVLLFGLLTALAPGLPLAPTAFLTMAFALLHGHAHGAEMPAGASAIAYGAGFLAGSALLIGAGLMAGELMRRRKVARMLPAGGAVIAAAGGWLLAFS